MNPIDRLQNLEAKPEEQAELAVSLLRKDTRHDVLLAALTALASNPSKKARVPLLDMYQHLAQNGVKRDPGAYLRGAILNALRPIAKQDDIPLLVDAVKTYEFLPPNFSEEAVILRASALVCLNDSCYALK